MIAAVAQGQAVAGDWLVADAQLAGAGRSGRAWLSPVGNLYASGVIALLPGDPPAPSLALAVGLAAHDVMRAIAPGVRAWLKWPNDVIVDAGKVAGILLQRQGDAVIAGIGMNLAVAPGIAGRATASLGLDPGVAGASAIEHLIDATTRRVEQWRGALSATRAAWLRVAHPLGTPLDAELPDGERLAGRFAGLADDGALQLSLPGGAVRTIHAGDVALGATTRGA